MPTVNELMSQNISNAQIGVQTWGDIIINVKAAPYNAKGDGIKNDTAAIQKAIDYAIKIGKHEVTFPAGIYKYGTLTNTSGITFIGDGVTLLGGTPINLTSLAALSASTVQRLSNIITGSVGYGPITIPNDFATIPFNLYRDRDGFIKHDYSLAQYDTGDVTIYCNVAAANDSKDGLSEANANRSIWKAIEIAVARPETNIIIKIMGGGFFIRDRSPTVEYTITNKRITISTLDSNVFWSGNADVLSWSATSGQPNVYQAARTNSCGVMDKRALNLDIYGIPKSYKLATSISDCNSKEGSWYTDGVNIYTHTIGAIAPDNIDIIGTTKVECWKFKLINSTLVIKNANIYNGGSFDGINVYDLTTDNASRLIMNNVKVFHSNYFNLYETSAGNGVASEGLGQTLLFNCINAYSNRDGFNYHYTSIPIGNRRSCLAFEYNCIAYNCGINDTNNNDNATTMHEGACVLRVGTIGFNTRGPVQADVNASYSINYDTHMRDSIAATASNKVAFKFHTDGATIGLPGKAILINCTGGGSVSYGIYRDGDTDTIFTLQNFRGADLRDVNTLTIIR